MSKLTKLVKKFLESPPKAKFDDVCYVLKHSFEEGRAKGSHHSFRHPDGRKITVPKVGGQSVKQIYLQKVVDLLDLESWQRE